MTSNLILTFPKKLNLTKTVDSSELSSDSETNKDLDESLDNTNSYQIQQTNKISTNEFFSPKRIIVEKRPRFFSENTENFKYNKEIRSKKIKAVTKYLRKFAEDEIDYLNKRKFSFI